MNADYTDFLGVKNHKIFKNARESLPEKISASLNLLTVKDDVLFVWDFKNNCVLSLNISATRNASGEEITHQSLLPLNPPLFSPELLRANDNLTLVAVAGPSGVLILELPARYPPHGAFDHNKDVVVCRSYSLDERLLLCSDRITVKQVKFHPGSVNNNHVVVLTSENLLRFYKIENLEAVNLAVYQLGTKPQARFPGSNLDMLAFFGETAVDFDFGQPDIEESYIEAEDNTGRHKTDKRGYEITLYNVRTQTEQDKVVPKYLSDIHSKENDKKDWTNLVWPIYVLRGDGSIYTLSVSLTKKTHPKLRGPLPFQAADGGYCVDACSLICLKTSPEILCCCLTNGLVNHILVLPIDYECGVTSERKRSIEDDGNVVSLIDLPTKELYMFETVELDMGLSGMPKKEKKEKVELLYLHKDESNNARYFVTHSTGIHTVDMPVINELQRFAADSADDRPAEDLFSQSSKAEYLVCTQSSSSDKPNPVIGFAPYYNPPSLVALLADGTVMTMAVVATPYLKSVDKLSSSSERTLSVESPLKKMMNEPFDIFIQKILKFQHQPILKLSTNTNCTQKDCYELLQRTAQIFREKYFPNHIKAQEEIEKRVKYLKMLKEYQSKELNKMKNEKQSLQEKAENLAEKYEDIKDKQDELMNRCLRLLILVSQKKSEPSDAEKEFLEELEKAKNKVEAFQKSTEKLKIKKGYQKLKVEDWKSHELRKHPYITEIQENTIRHNLEDMTKKIHELYEQIANYKKSLNLK